MAVARSSMHRIAISAAYMPAAEATLPFYFIFSGGRAGPTGQQCASRALYRARNVGGFCQPTLLLL